MTEPSTLKTPNSTINIINGVCITRKTPKLAIPKKVKENNLSLPKQMHQPDSGSNKSVAL